MLDVISSYLGGMRHRRPEYISRSSCFSAQSLRRRPEYGTLKRHDDINMNNNSNDELPLPLAAATTSTCATLTFADPINSYACPTIRRPPPFGRWILLFEHLARPGLESICVFTHLAVLSQCSGKLQLFPMDRQEQTQAPSLQR